MKRRQFTFVLTLVFLFFYLFILVPQSAFADDTTSDKLLILFTTADKEVMTKMAAPYPMFGLKQGWWKETRFLIWGPSAKMIAEDEDAQKLLAQMQEAGVELLACKWCAEQYSVAEKLAELGVKVEYMGQPLTEMLKTDWKVLTF